MKQFIDDFIDAAVFIGMILLSCIALVVITVGAVMFVAALFDLAVAIAGNREWLAIPVAIIELIVVAALGYAGLNSIYIWWNK